MKKNLKLYRPGVPNSLLQRSQRHLSPINHHQIPSLANNPLGYNGERKDPVTGFYHLGGGYRVYSPTLMRFHASDSASPFGQGGLNSYAYCLGDPINLRDPSGHFALLSLLIGAIVGAVAGAVISAGVEGIRAAVTRDHFDWRQVGIGAALGAISGGFGALAQGTRTGVQVGLVVADTVVSSAADFGLNVAMGNSAKEAGINAGIGAVIGLVTFWGGRMLRRNKINTILKERSNMQSLQNKSHIIQKSADLKDVYYLELNVDNITQWRLKKIQTGEVSIPSDGHYLFVNRVDEPGKIRIAKPSSLVEGHTSMTQEGGKILDVWFAGELNIIDSKLENWTNGSGHYRPNANLYKTNLIPWVKRILPPRLFLKHRPNVPF
ncbi:hypothetical protein M5U04_20720 [Xenorhabdus sp. XENO-1]|uniref:RHS repeat-associated core domain-containing protein n=1 Tax=Xenorhabdus bovienii TaxID=40576 RepID=UPI0020CA4582|nr:RHS repeat-associated core domain-containing protein [Xenorhabdus bovienii]MCP9270425.1 hypothetical protein [Xenorhabdus bovienii subsp. africana]